MDRESLRQRRRRMRRRQMLQKAGKISVSVVVGLLFIAGSWRLLSPHLEKKGIITPESGVVNTVQAAVPESEDGSGKAGIAALAATKPGNEVPGWQYSSSGWWYATSDTTYYANGWVELDGRQYHFDGAGYMDTGWTAIAGKGYCFDEQGVYQPEQDASRMIAMTFDDGPSSHTGQLLDILEANGAKATFFMQGCNVELYGAENIPRMAALGCDIGNHSYDHPDMRKIGTESGLTQFQKTDDLIAQYNNGQPASVIRFPFGEKTDEIAAAVGRPCFMWSIDTLDWKTKNVQSNISAVLDHASAGDIVLMHDIYQTTVESCATIIPELVQRGYQLVTLRTLAAANGVDLENGETYFDFYPAKDTAE